MMKENKSKLKSSSRKCQEYNMQNYQPMRKKTWHNGTQMLCASEETKTSSPSLSLQMRCWRALYDTKQMCLASREDRKAWPEAAYEFSISLY